MLKFFIIMLILTIASDFLIKLITGTMSKEDRALILISNRPPASLIMLSFFNFLTTIGVVVSGILTAIEIAIRGL